MSILLACTLAWAGQPDGPPSPAPAGAADPAVESALAELERRSAEVRDLTARFEEQKHTALLKKPMVSHGTLRMVGARARWETEQPHRAITVRDQRELRIYYPERKTVEIYELDAAMPMPEVSPLPRPAELRRHFQIAGRAVRELDAACEVDACLALHLTPREAKLREHVTAVDVVVDRASGMLRRAEITDPDGDRTVFIFSDIKVNTGLTERDVALTLPEGTKEFRPLSPKQRGSETREDGER